MLHSCMPHTQQWLQLQIRIWPRLYITLDELDMLSSLKIDSEHPASTLIHQFCMTKGQSEQQNIAARQLLRVSQRPLSRYMISQSCHEQEQASQLSQDTHPSNCQPVYAGTSDKCLCEQVSGKVLTHSTHSQHCYPTLSECLYHPLGKIRQNESLLGGLLLLLLLPPAALSSHAPPPRHDKP